MLDKSRADYFKKRRENKKNFSVYIDKNKAQKLDQKLKDKRITKREWLEDHVEEEVGIDFKRKITCPHCNNITVINLREYIEDESSYERQMGSQIEHTINCEEFKCPKCSENFTIKGSIWEYPEGTFNSEEIKVISDEKK